MLKDRRVLLEQELRGTQTKAGQLYLEIIRSGSDAHDVRYQSLKEQIADVQSDLNIVNELIDSGHE